MLVVNLFGAPGSGKSTGAAKIFSELKFEGANCELVTEYAKDKLWEGSQAVFNDQIYIFAKQNFRLSRLEKIVDVVVTDSPILLSLIYNKGQPSSFDRLVLDKFEGYNNFNVFLNRVKPYQPIGRFQNESESNAISHDIKRLLNSYFIPYNEIEGCKEGYDIVVKDILDILRREQYDKNR